MSTSFFERHQVLVTLNISALFVFFGAAIIRSLPVSVFDTTFAGLVWAWQTGFRTFFMESISAMFHPVSLVICTALIAFFFVLRRRLAWAAFFLLTMACSVVSVLVAKELFAVARPISVVTPEWGWSFPSLHASTVAVFFLSLVYGIEEKIHRHIVVVFWGMAGFLCVCAVGFSRVYLGAHWVSDVLAGFALGAFWASLGILLLERVHEIQGSHA
jgi:undecaprenyl-diphosphatase